MSLNKRSKGFAGIVLQGWEVTEAYGIEVQVEKLLKRPHRLSWPLGDSRSGWTEPPGELVLQRIPNDDDPSLRQVERDAARGVSRKVDHADFDPERKGVAVLEVIIDRDGASHEPREDGLRHRREQFVLKRTPGGRRALNDVRFQPMHGDRDPSSRNQFAEAARVVWMGMSNNYSPNLVSR